MSDSRAPGQDTLHAVRHRQHLGMEQPPPGHKLAPFLKRLQTVSKSKQHS